MSTPYPSQPGPKLQKLIDHGLLSPQHVQQLQSSHLEAIEQLTHSEIGALIDAHEKVGQVPSSQFI